MPLYLVTGPALEPLTTAEAKSHLRVDISDDDTYIDTLVLAARRYVEFRTWEALVTQTWEYVMDAWPAGDTIYLPRPPLQSVTSVTYYDDDGDANTFASTNYVVDIYSKPGRLRLKSSSSWPSETLRELNAIVIRYVAGYGVAAASVPQHIRHAMLMLVGHWYENREAVATTGAVPKQLELAVESLLRVDNSRRFDL